MISSFNPWFWTKQPPAFFSNFSPCSMESVDEKFMKFSKSGCHPGWSGLHILVESGFESMINHESNQHQPMWITILSNRDPFVMVCCHNPHITGLFFIPKKSRNPLGPTVWALFLHCCSRLQGFEERAYFFVVEVLLDVRQRQCPSVAVIHFVEQLRQQSTQFFLQNQSPPVGFLI